MIFIKVEQLIFSNGKWQEGNSELGHKAQLVFVFGCENLIRNKEIFNELKQRYANAYITGCTTAGEIYQDSVFQDTLSATAIYFENTPIKSFTAEINDPSKSYEIAKKLAESIPQENLKNIFLIVEGINVNGSRLVDAFKSIIPGNISVSGGFSGNGDNLSDTYIIANDYPKKNMIVAIAFYGDNIRISCGFAGGWDTFGVERVVTKSIGDEVFEIDGKPALDLYKEYLGEYAKELPGIGLQFPLEIRAKDSDYSFMRSFRKVNEDKKSLIFAADIPQEYYCRMMKANFNNLVNASIKAADISMKRIAGNTPKLAILISCVARKLVLKQMTDEEIEAARESIGTNCIFTGFYSYGEICPLSQNSSCELHNQTMTITLFDEV
jgi:hypothetical protein